MEIGFDMSELSELSEGLVDMATVRYPKETKKFMRSEGNKLRKLTKSIAKSRIKHRKAKDDPKNTRYLANIKRGKTYHFQDDPTDASIRVYSYANHAHLIEEGHVVKVGSYAKGNVRDPKKGERFVKGYEVFIDAEDQFEDGFEQDVSDYIDDMLDRGLY